MPTSTLVIWQLAHKHCRVSERHKCIETEFHVSIAGRRCGLAVVHDVILNGAQSQDALQLHVI